MGVIIVLTLWVTERVKQDNPHKVLRIEYWPIFRAQYILLSFRKRG